ncbi:hypothetical protein [Thioflexithrix psekupsensis]|uniref:Uncharacterized protein n=1 Tax=Thioflexithrix psekupsensis TaxID=1570016 RepID=A0A251XAC8_9GAMM|nr:hypothetical protein [Thioflexithrix psekupsensis]OUD15268.1 hypothetical protein TPSD3_01695 [Thioflexithrix psekupsensis]
MLKTTFFLKKPLSQLQGFIVTLFISGILITGLWSFWQAPADLNSYAWWEYFGSYSLILMVMALLFTAPFTTSKNVLISGFLGAIPKR